MVSRYHITLEDIGTAAAMLDRIMEVADKTWASSEVVAEQRGEAMVEQDVTLVGTMGRRRSRTAGSSGSSQSTFALLTRDYK